MTEWLIPLASSPVLLGLGVVLQRWIASRSKEKRDAVSDLQHLADERKHDNEDCRQRLDRAEQRLDHCEEQHHQAEKRNIRLEAEINSLRQTVNRHLSLPPSKP